MKLSPFLLALLLSASVAWGAIDFFGLPEKIVVPKSVTATPAPAAPVPVPVPPPPLIATPPPAIPSGGDGKAPTLIPDGVFLKTPSVGAENSSGRSFYDVGPNNGVLIGFQYTLGQNNRGGSAIESLTPLYVRAAGKATGITRGNRSADNPATVLEAKPGYAVGSIDVRGVSGLESMRVVFMRYENGALDPSDTYTGNWIGGRSAPDAQTAVHLRTDHRPFVGMYGKATSAINEFGLLVRKEAIAPVEPPSFPPEPRDPPHSTGGTEVVKYPTTPPRITPPPVAPPPTGAVQVFACANEHYTLYLNGREILAGSNGSEVQTGNFPVLKGDVFCAVVKDSSTDNLWFSLRVVRDGTTILDAGDMLYQTTEPPAWKTSRLTSGFREPRVTTHRDKTMGTDSRPRAARPGPKDAAATTLYLKGVVQQ